MGLVVKDREIKNAIGDLIEAAVSTYYTGLAKDIHPRVHRRWVLSHNLGESAALLKAIAGEDRGKVHAWMIGNNGYKRIRPTRSGEDYIGLAVNGSLGKVGPNVRYLIKSYRIWCYVQLETGDDDNNSENTLMSEIEYVANHLSKYPTLGITTKEIQGHTELSFEPIDVFKFGEIQANVAQGQIDVYLFEPIT